MAVVSLLFATIFLFMPRKIFTIWLLALTFGFGFPAYQALSPAPLPAGAEKAHIKILQFNVLYLNEELKNAIPWIIKQDADIVVLQEISEPRANELTELKNHYSWSQIKTNDRRKAFGMAIFSNLAVSKFDYIDIGDGENNYSLTEFSINGGKLHMYEIHTQSPVTPLLFDQRNFELSVVAEAMSKDKAPYRMLVGDMNSTIYSPYLQNVMKKVGLHSAQQGYHLEGTWNSFLPPELCIGIDHILVSKQIKIERREIGPDLASDHFPVITTLSLYGDANAKD